MTISARSLTVGMMLAWGLAGVVPASAARWAAVEQPELKQQLDGAAPLDIEDVCIPVKSVRRDAPMLVPNPDGKTYDVLAWYYKGYSGPTTVHIIDLGTGEVKTDGIPLGRQIHICGQVLGPDGKYYMATPDRKRGMELYVYDPAANELSCLGVVAPGLGGERRPLVVGTDGKIHGSGSYSDNKRVGAYQLDTATGKITDYGPMGPSHAPAGSWGYYAAADDEYVYVASGKVPWYLVAYNKRTGEDTVLLETDRVHGTISVRQLPDGCTARASHAVGGPTETTEYWLYKGRAIAKTGADPPWPEREKRPWDRQLHRKPEIYREGLEPDPSGTAALWYRTAETSGWKVIRFDVEMYPMQVDRLYEMPDGRIIGTADAYLGNFIFDPATGKSEHMGKIHLSHYSTAFAGGKAYMSGYPSSPVFVYDPARPWTVGCGTPDDPAPSESDPASNPRLLVRLNQFCRTHKMYGAAAGADGRVYFGGACMRNANGGGIGWWDPKTEQAGGIWEPFTAYQIHWLVAVEGGRRLVASTRAVRDDIRDNYTPEQAKLFVFDVATQRIVQELEPVNGAMRTGGIVEALPGKILGATSGPETKGGLLYGVDLASGTVDFVKTVPYDFGLDTGRNTYGTNEYRAGPGGWIWTYIGNTLVRIHPATVRIEVVGVVDQPGRIAFAGDDIYLAGTEHLRRIAGAAKRP